MLPVCEQGKIAGLVVGFPASRKSSRGPSPAGVGTFAGNEFASGMGGEYAWADRGILDSCVSGRWRI